MTENHEPIPGFTGEIVRPGDDGYPSASRTALAVGTPSIVLRPRDEEEVRHAVRWAAGSGLEIAVRGGGHSAAGFGTVDGGVVIDLGALREVRMLDERRVRVGGGSLWRDVLTVLAPRGLAISSGDTADVGVGGLTLSGGIGWMVRRDGLALDSLRAVELVTIDGDVVRADAQHHQDLFWAVRGGGGSFGIVTAFEFEAHEGGEVGLVRATFPADQAQVVTAGWRAYMATAPDDVSSTLVLADPLAGGRDAPIAITAVVSGGSDAAAVADALAALGAGELDTARTREVRRMLYAEVLHDGAELPTVLRVAARAHFVPEESADEAAALVAVLARSENPLPFTLHALGGAFGRVDARSTAFAHRDAALMITTFSVVPEAALDATRRTQDAVWRRLGPFTSGAYANALDGASDEAVADVHAASSRARLAAVKAQYDPRGLLSRNFTGIGNLSGAGEDAA